MKIEATAPAKLVLLGEYAVLEGAPAIVAAVDRTARVTLAPAEGERWRFSSDLPDFPTSHVLWSADGLHVEVEAGAHDEWTVLPGTVIECVCRIAGVDPATLEPLDIHVASSDLFDDDAKLGLGSSAAVTVALATALRRHLHTTGRLADEPGPEDAILEDLYINAEVQDGHGSGVDIAAATFGGILAYQVADDSLSVEPVSLPEEIVFATVWTGTPASTTSFLSGMLAYEEGAPDAYAEHIAKLRAFAERGLVACQANDAADWLDVVRSWTPAMAALGLAADLPIISAAHAELAALAATEDCAYKPSGAGGGDVGLLFARSSDALALSTAKAEQAGYRCVPLHVRTDGVQLR